MAALPVKIGLASVSAILFHNWKLFEKFLKNQHKKISEKKKKKKKECFMKVIKCIKL